MQVDVTVTLAVPPITVKLWDNVIVEIDPMPGLRDANICLDPKVPSAVYNLVAVVKRFNALMGEVPDSPIMSMAGEHTKNVIEGWWRDVIKAAIEDGTFKMVESKRRQK